MRDISDFRANNLSNDKKYVLYYQNNMLNVIFRQYLIYKILSVVCLQKGLGYIQLRHEYRYKH